jgi:ribonuclease HI
MYFDGSKRVQGAGAGVVLISPQGDKLKYVLRMSFPQASNNEAEYEALLHRMKMAKACGATRLKIFRVLNLVVQQVMNRCDAISDNMTAYINLYYYLEGQQQGSRQSSKYRVPMLTHTARSLLGRNHREINKEQQNFDYRRTRPAPSNRVRGWQAWPRKHSRTRRSYDDRRNLDAAIPGIHNKQGTTQRHSRSKKDNTTIQGFRRVTRETIQEKHNGHPAAMRHSSRRTRNIKRHPRRSMRTSR